MRRLPDIFVPFELKLLILACHAARKESLFLWFADSQASLGNMPMAPTSPVIAADALRNWVAALLRARSMPPDHAEIVALALVDANLRGIDTHGVRQLPDYLGLLARRVISVMPDLQIAVAGPLLKVQAGRGFGAIVGTLAVDAAIEVARKEGCAIATIAEVGHLGALGYFTRRAAGAGLVALLMQNGPPLMAPAGSSQRAIGNNPLSFAAPVEGHGPIVFDMAASEAAFGKIIEAKAAGTPIPEGWALDNTGAPTRDPAAALSGMLLPIAGGKGLGLAMMVQCFAGSLSGTRPVWGEGIFGGFLMLVDPAATIGEAAFQADMSHWLAHYKAATGGRLPGERGDALLAERSRTGVLLPPDLIAALSAAGAEHGLHLPIQNG